MEQFSKKATIDNMGTVIDFLINKLKNDIKLTKKISNEIHMLCEEILMNIISYAYKDFDNIGTMTVIYNFDKSENALIIDFMDYGVEFNPLKKKDPDITLDIMERDIGGLGIYMIKQIADKIEYNRIDNMNKLTIKKFMRKCLK